MDWIVHKFGGSSLADAERMARVADLLAGLADPGQVVVVSAMKGVTDRLLALARQAAAGDKDWPLALEALEREHRDAATQLAGADHPVHAELDADFDRLGELLRSLGLMGSVPEEVAELISGLGEVWSARLLSARFERIGQEALFVDAREILRTRPTELQVAVDWPASGERLDAFRRAHPARRYVVTGYICRLSDGRISVLGRNGSDYSATIFARLFEAGEVHIWTDVDGLLSADPEAVPQAHVLDHLSYREAFELAYFGARVLHPQALGPALAADIPVFIRNTFNPDHPGTRVDADGHPAPPVKGISATDDQALVTIEGTGMIGVPGTAERVFSALNRAGVSVTMISQGSSEHSICVVVHGNQREQAVAVLRDAFERELRHALIQRIEGVPDISVTAIVGEGMAGTPGIAARLFLALSRAGVNVRAIAQGASERNISVAIDSRDKIRALRAVHAGFYLSEQTVSIGLIGPGQVGGALLEQLMAARRRLLEERQIDLRLRAVAGSRRMWLSETGFESADLDAGPAPQDVCLDRLTEQVADDLLPHSVIIDCTASDALADRYAGWLARGIHVITPNKHAGSGALERYSDIRAHTGSAARWRYEATVGAGLPIIQTLRDLLDTGDRLLRIDGILSGTLAWLFNRFEPGMRFSGLVAEARACGYTEPDPRDDLSGMDVARKLVILAREAGLALSLGEVAVESLSPPELDGDDIDTFLERLGDHDGVMADRLDRARQNGRLLRYIASLDFEHSRAGVGLEAVAADHPFAHMALTDNIVAFTTERYRDNPLIVQGPGAGPAVTAGGVFADLLRVVDGLGARP